MSGAGMLLDGDRTSGMDVRNANVTAAVAIANDGATILAQLDIEHPAAKVLVELAQLQDQEVGDGTTSVVIVAAELLKKANELVKEGIHPTVVMSGFRIAVKEAVKYIKDNLVVKGEDIGPNNLISAGRFLTVSLPPSLSSVVAFLYITKSSSLFISFSVTPQPKPLCRQKSSERNLTSFPTWPWTPPCEYV